MGYLISDGVNDVVSLPAGSTSNVGTTAYTWWIKGTLRAAPSGLAGILGTSSFSTSSGFATNATLQLRVYSAGTNRYGTGDNFFEVGVYHHYRLEHDAGGAWRAYRDDMVTPVASGTFTGNFTFGALNQMFRSSSAATMWTAWDMVEMGITSTTFSETYQADLSGGTGSILPTVSGNNNGTLVNFPTDGSQWGGFGSSATLSFAGTLPKLTASSTLIVAASVSVAGSLPKLSASATISVLTASSVSFSGVFPKLSASALINVVPASIAISVSGSLPKLRCSISVNATQLPVLSFSGAMPRLRMSAALVSVKPLPTGDTLAIKQALVNARRAEENRNNEYIPPVVVVPEWWIIQQQALGLKQSEVNRARESEE